MGKAVFCLEKMTGRCGTPPWDTSPLLVPSRTILEHFYDISGKFDQAIGCIFGEMQWSEKKPWRDKQTEK